MSRTRPGFDRLARWYRALEFIAFGRDLERARFAFLERVADRTSILLLGEGDGRCAARLVIIAPKARIVCVDSSPGMIARASQRVKEAGGEGRVTFECADVRSFTPEAGRFDAVATLFFLDCFGEEDVASIVSRTSAGLSPGATWLFADFALPPRALARARARIWLALLYACFRWETALAASSLPPSEQILKSAGWKMSEWVEFQWGLIRSCVFSRPRDVPVTEAR